MAKVLFIDNNDNQHDCGAAPIAVGFDASGEIILGVSLGDETAYNWRLSYDEAATLMQHLHTSMKMSVERR